MSKKRAAALLGLTLLFAAASQGAGPALDVPPLTARVNDTAGMLSLAAAAALEAKLADYETATTNQLVLLTVPSLKGDILESFSVRVAEAWKIGRKRVDNGVIVVIVKDERKIRVEVGYGLEGSLTDAVSARIIAQAMAPRFREDDYESGLTAGFEALMRAAEHPAPPDEKPRGRSLGGWIVLILILLAGYGFAGLLAYGGLFARGAGIMMYIFDGTLLGLAGAYIREQGARFGYWIFFAFLIGVPILKLILPRTAWGKERVLKADAAAKAAHVSGSSPGHWTRGGFGSSGGSSGGGFSGGGGSFGGGGASGGW